MKVTAFKADWELHDQNNPYRGYFSGGLTLVEGNEKYYAMFTWMPGVQGLTWQLYRDNKPAVDERMEFCNKYGTDAVMWLFQKIQEYYNLVPNEMKTDFHVAIVLELQKIMIDAFLWELRVDLWRAFDVALIIPPEHDEQQPAE